MVKVVSREQISDDEGYQGELVKLDNGGAFNSWLKRAYEGSNGEPFVLEKGMMVRVVGGADGSMFSKDFQEGDGFQKPAAGQELITGEIISLRDNAVWVHDGADPENSKTLICYPSSDQFMPFDR